MNFENYSMNIKSWAIKRQRMMQVEGLEKNYSRIYYIIYKAVFLNAYNKQDCPLVIDLFLKYGFLDETLLREEQLEELVELEEETSAGPCSVYDMKQWLTLIYTGKKLPSKSGI